MFSLGGSSKNKGNGDQGERPVSSSRLQSKQKLSELLHQKTTRSGHIQNSSEISKRRSSTKLVDPKEALEGYLWRKNEGHKFGLGPPFIKMWCVVDAHRLVYYDTKPEAGGIAGDVESRGYIIISNETKLAPQDDDAASDMWTGMGKAVFSVSESSGADSLKVLL